MLLKMKLLVIFIFKASFLWCAFDDYDEKCGCYRGEGEQKKSEPFDVIRFSFWF